MAISRILHGTGTQNLSTANCEYVSNADEIHATTNVVVNSTNVGLAYTAPSLVDKATGVALYFSSIGTAGTIVFNLQEYNGAAWVTKASTASITITTLSIGWHYFVFSAPYTYATLTASYYRISSTLTSGSGTFQVAAHLTSTTLYCTVVSDSRTAAFSGSALNTLIAGNDLASYLPVVDTTGLTVGAGSADSTLGYATPRHTGNAIVMAANTYLSWSTTASSDITLKGSFGSASYTGIDQSTAVPNAYTAKLIFNENGTSGNFGVNSLYETSKWILKGTPPTYRRTQYTSGTGTAADPLLTTENVAAGALATPWKVNDELLICSTSGYAESETRYIKTVVGDNSFVVSTTVGGAEAALTYTHLANAYILNVTRNFIVTTTNTSHGWYYYEAPIRTTVGSHNAYGARFEQVGANLATQKQGYYFNPSAGLNYISMDYCVFANMVANGLIWNANGGAPQTYEENFFVNTTIDSNWTATSFSSTTSSKTLNWWFYVNLMASGLLFSSSVKITANDCKFISCNKGGGSVRGGIQFTTGSINIRLNRCEVQASRIQNVYIGGGINGIFDTCEFGSKGNVATYDVYLVNAIYADTTFKNCLFNAPTLLGNYANAAVDSEVRFHKYNQTENYHFWYTPYGKLSATGTGLPDTTVRTANSLGLNGQATSIAAPLTYQFKVFSKANYAVSALGFIQRDATFNTTGTITVDLYLPGSISADDTYTMPTTTGTWDIFIVAANYTGTVDGYATVIITATSAAINGKFYVDDIFNGTNHITALELWENAKPSPVMFEQLGDASAVWQVPTNTLTANGTIGKFVTKLLSVAKFLALK